jgi:hypothetical protein
MRKGIVIAATTLADFYAKELHRALSGIFKNNTDLVEMLSTIRHQDLIDANYAYWLRILLLFSFFLLKKMEQFDILGYCVSLEFDIKHNIFGFYQRLLVNLSLPRRSNLPPDRVKAKQDATELFKAGN